MGCDIHIHVEYKRNNDKEAVWQNGDYFKKNPYYTKNSDEENEFIVAEVFSNRDYSLFSTLAGVRDYSEKVIPVSDPKGFPEDASYVTRQSYEDWGCDAHTPSWLTLKQLKEFQNNSPVMHYSGMISPEQAQLLDEKAIIPNTWCQWTSREDHVKREWSEPNDSLLPLIKRLIFRAEDLYVREPENIRIVFWFDN